VAYGAFLRSHPRSHDCISRPRLASGEMKLRLPPRASLGRDRTTCPVRGWPLARQNCISHRELASTETELCLPPRAAGVGRDIISSPAQSWPRVRRICISHLELTLGKTKLCLPSEVGLWRDRTVSPIQS
jgi:hypothetical protein